MKNIVVNQNSSEEKYVMLEPIRRDRNRLLFQSQAHQRRLATKVEGHSSHCVSLCVTMFVVLKITN